MKKNIATVFVAVLVVVVTLSTLKFLSFSELFPFRRDLTFTVIEQSESSLVEFRYYGNATDSKTVVANLNLRVEQEFNNQRRVYFDLQHKGNTELDSVTLKF